MGLILLVDEIRAIKRQGSIALITQDCLRLVVLPLGLMIGFLPAAVIYIATFGQPYYSEN